MTQAGKGDESGQLSLLLSLFLLRISTLGLAITLVVLDILVVNRQGLINLGAKSAVIFDAVQDLVSLTGDFS